MDPAESRSRIGRSGLGGGWTALPHGGAEPRRQGRAIWHRCRCRDMPQNRCRVCRSSGEHSGMARGQDTSGAKQAVRRMRPGRLVGRITRRVTDWRRAASSGPASPGHGLRHPSQLPQHGQQRRKQSPAQQHTMPASCRCSHAVPDRSGAKRATQNFRRRLYSRPITDARRRLRTIGITGTAAGSSGFCKALSKASRSWASLDSFSIFRPNTSLT